MRFFKGVWPMMKLYLVRDCHSYAQTFHASSGQYQQGACRLAMLVIGGRAAFSA
jgi:hypothetical protein